MPIHPLSEALNVRRGSGWVSPPLDLRPRICSRITMFKFFSSVGYHDHLLPNECKFCSQAFGGENKNSYQNTAKYLPIQQHGHD
jgi:hypothetical protein